MTWQTIDTAPRDSTPIRVFAKQWIDEDFNPSGSIEAFWQSDQGFIGAMWNASFDAWDAVVVEPTHWMALPDPPQ